MASVNIYSEEQEGRNGPKTKKTNKRPIKISTTYQKEMFKISFDKMTNFLFLEFTTFCLGKEGNPILEIELIIIFYKTEN